MVPTVTDECIVPTETEFIQTLYCIFSSLPSENLQSPGVAAGRIKMCIIFLLVESIILFFLLCNYMAHFAEWCCYSS